MDILTWSDGKKTLLDIAEITNTPIWEYYSIIETLKKHNLISII